MKSPIISVIIPCFNASKTIAGVIQSLVDQTYANWEAIIVDDGSPDIEATERIIARFSDNRIKFIREKHKGIPGACMRGFKASRGEIVTIHGADDLSLPDRFEWAVRCFDDSKLDVLVHDIYVSAWHPGLNCIARHYRGAGSLSKSQLLREQGLIGVPLFRRRVLDKKPLREATKFAYDWMMHLDWVFSGFKYALLNRPLYEYVRHQNSASERFERLGQRKESLTEIGKIMKKEYKVTFNPKG